MPSRDLALPDHRRQATPETERREPRTAPKLDAILALQRSAGNAAVARLLADEGEPQAEHEEPTSGTIEDLVGEELSTGGCDHPDADRPAVPYRLNARIDFAAHAGSAAPARPSGRRPDAVGSTVNFGSKVTEGGATPGAGEFGVENVTYKADNTSWKQDKATNTVNVETRIFLDIGWGVHSLGRTNVPGPNDPVVKKDTWTAIRDDLKPDGTGRPTRSTYWAKDLTEKHEKFHASDDIQRSRLYIPTAKAYLDAQTVDGSSAAKIEADVRKHVEKVRSDVEADGWAYYDRAGGAGENRAYADGKASYQKRVDDISARATTEKW